MQIVRELKAMAQALRPPRNRAKAVAAASISSAELDARGIPSGRPKPSTTQVWKPLLSAIDLRNGFPLHVARIAAFQHELCQCCDVGGSNEVLAAKSSIV